MIIKLQCTDPEWTDKEEDSRGKHGFFWQEDMEQIFADGLRAGVGRISLGEECRKRQMKLGAIWGKWCENLCNRNFLQSMRVTLVRTPSMGEYRAWRSGERGNCGLDVLYERKIDFNLKKMEEKENRKKFKLWVAGCSGSLDSIE